MSECENPARRNEDSSRMAKLANSAIWNLSSRIAVLIVMSLLAFIAQRSLLTLDTMATDIRSLTKEVAVVVKDLAILTTQNITQEKRLDGIEAREIRSGGRGP